MKNGKTVYIIDVHGVDVLEREFLRDDDVFVYSRRRGESGRGSKHPKLFAYFSKQDAYNEAANRLEARAKEHRREATKCCLKDKCGLPGNNQTRAVE